MGAFILIVIILVFSLVRLSAKSKKGASKTHKSGAKQSSAKSAAAVFEDIKKEDILTAAKENTVEVAQDNDRDAEIWEVNLDQVYDLMVKGPADTLTFQRDFVAEGMDMLNKYTTLPDAGTLSGYL